MSISYLSDDSCHAPSATKTGSGIDLNAFCAVFDDSPQGVFVHRRHKPLYVNHAWAAIHGYMTDEIMALKTVVDLISAEDRARMVTYNEDRLAGRSAPMRYHYQVVQKSGLQLWVEIFVQKLEWLGEPAVQCTVIDARPRDAWMAERLRRAEDTNEKFLCALEESSEGFALFDSDHRLVVWNPRFVEINPELDGVLKAGMPFEDIVRFCPNLGLVADAAGDDEAFLEKRLCSFRNDGHLIDMQVSDGRWYQVRERRLPDGHILMSSLDITERRKAEQALAEERSFLRAVIDNVPAAIYAKDRESRFILKNRFDAELMGAETVEETIGKTDFDYFPEDTALGFYEEDRQVIEQGAIIVSKEQRFIRGHDDRPTWLSATKAPLRNSVGEIIGLVGCSHDITERKALELDLAKHRDHLQELVAERTAELQQQAERLAAALDRERELAGLQRQFVSMVSHEFRTPLAIIDGHAHIIQKRSVGILPDRSIQGLGKIRHSVRLLTDLMESFLATANIEDGRIAIVPGDCALHEIITELAKSLGELHPKHKILLDIDQLPQCIIADSKLLHQVFSNLISNALKYSPDGGCVWIAARAKDDCSTVISVRDEGVGIPKDEQSKLFNRFFRASTSRGIAGTGIGLHLAMHIVQMHEGMIDVESVEGQGTTFRVHLPDQPPLANDDDAEAEHAAFAQPDNQYKLASSLTLAMLNQHEKPA